MILFCKQAAGATIRDYRAFNKMTSSRIAISVLGALIAWTLLYPTRTNADNAEPAISTEPPSTYNEQAPLTLDEKISAGRRKFGDPWSLRNELDGVWGLGPTFNENSCPGCHRNASRSAAPGHGQEAKQGMVIRLSVMGHDAHGGPRPHIPIMVINYRTVPLLTTCRGKAARSFFTIPSK